MMNKIVAVQGDHPSKLNPSTDTSIFLINEIQKKIIIYFIMIQKIYLSLAQRLLQKVFFIKFSYNKKIF